jgi:hypothetical protein
MEDASQTGPDASPATGLGKARVRDSSDDPLLSDLEALGDLVDSHEFGQVGSRKFFVEGLGGLSRHTDDRRRRVTGSNELWADRPDL